MQTSRSINGVRTEVLILSYADRVLVLLTQLGKVGCLIQASTPSTIPLPPAPPLPSLPPIPPSIALTPLFGQPPSPHLQTLFNLYVSQIASLIWACEGDSAMRRPVVVGVALKLSTTSKSAEDEDDLTEDERSLFKEVMEMVLELVK
ncbi:hypothetical protein FRB94_014666 [Tulasnella sp. JGI-2019a]|nr:hypothetical protein FRB93_002444 [Tulasnella sp. JGI-2019a]KAG9007098.1 hypothetical protein FRB94_014666 [Tulasnella sp. JGI-2019a]KAG9033204.1 hypothetical protein FRB95_000459 [Tulasnella sp. JGI-2019a]